MTKAEQRPTCETCPYFAGFTKRPRKGAAVRYGTCRRFPPAMLSLVAIAHATHVAASTPGDFANPTMHSEQWCGEHPDFPAWIARRRISTNGTPRQQDA